MLRYLAIVVNDVVVGRHPKRAPRGNTVSCADKIAKPTTLHPVHYIPELVHSIVSQDIQPPLPYFQKGMSEEADQASEFAGNKVPSVTDSGPEIDVKAQ